MLYVGIGEKKVFMFLSVLNILFIFYIILKCIEREVGKVVEDVVRYRCDFVVIIERENFLGIYYKLYYECIKFYWSNMLKNYYKWGLIVWLFIIFVI